MARGMWIASSRHPIPRGQTHGAKVYSVESCHLGGGLLEEWTGAADRADVWDPGGTHDTGRSGEEDPG